MTLKKRIEALEAENRRLMSQTSVAVGLANMAVSMISHWEWLARTRFHEKLDISQPKKEAEKMLRSLNKETKP